MKTRERYKLHSEKLKEHQADFYDLVQGLDISELKKLRLETLFECYAFAKENKYKESIKLINEKKK
jgi:hypothetical protein